MAEGAAVAQAVRRLAIRRLLVAAVVLGALLVIGGVPFRAVDALRPPDRFGPGFGGDVEVLIPSMPVGETLLVLMSTPEEAVMLDEAALIVRAESAAAVVDVVACQRREGSSVVGSAMGAPELTRHCEAIHRPTGVEVGGAITGHETYLLAVVQPLEPGRVVIDGLEVTHSRGRVHRTERTGETVELVAA